LNSGVKKKNYLCVCWCQKERMQRIDSDREQEGNLKRVIGNVLIVISSSLKPPKNCLYLLKAKIVIGSFKP